MLYISTRGGVSPKTFRDVALSGLASDGGLYLPESYPAIRIDRGTGFFEVAEAAISPFAPGLDLGQLLKAAWKDFPADPAPLKKLDDNLYLLELFHGPSAAFKDFGLQFLGAMFEAFSSGDLTVIGATSGDTGAAAVQSLKNRQGVRLFMLHPRGRISEIQRRQMTTSRAENIFNIAVEGSFDDCQRLLKQILARETYTTVNSINWARILAQSVYYRWAVARLSGRGPVHFIVPTGNFGNAFSGYVAMRTGAAISGVTIATNANDILPRALKTGVYEPRHPVATISPAMDIQIANNFERLLFEAAGRRPVAVKTAAQNLAEKGFYKIPGKALKAMTNFFTAKTATEEETRAAIKKAFENYHQVLDPHTAVGLGVLEEMENKPEGPRVLLATAHPAKFPETIPQAYLKSLPLPGSLSSLMEAPEVYQTLPADLGEIQKFIEARTHDG